MDYQFKPSNVKLFMDDINIDDDDQSVVGSSNSNQDFYDVHSELRDYYQQEHQWRIYRSTCCVVGVVGVFSWFSLFTWIILWKSGACSL